jgi:hypothetical protein
MRVKSSDKAHPPYEAVWYLAVWYKSEDLAILITIFFLLHLSLSPSLCSSCAFTLGCMTPFWSSLRGGATLKNLLTGQSVRNKLKSVIRTASYLAYHCMSAALLLHVSSFTTACQELTTACQLHSPTLSEYPSWKGMFYDKQVLAERTHGALHLLRKCLCADSDMHICGWWRTDTNRTKTKNNGWFSPQARTKASIRVFVPFTLFLTTPHVPPLFSVDVLLLIFISSRINKDDSRGGNNGTLQLWWV